MKEKLQVQIIIEKNRDGFWGRIERDDHFMPTGYGLTIEALLADIKVCIKDYIEHEGKDSKFWKKVYLKNIENSFKLSFEVTV